MQQSRPTVAPLTGEDARELFDIVGELEGLSAGLAARLPAVARQALVQELRPINNDRRTVAQASSPDHDRMWVLDDLFHQRCVDAAAGPRLTVLHSAVKPQAERYERLYVSFLAGEVGTSVTEHEAIIDAIETGDAKGAKTAVELNWQNAAERLGRVIERVGDRGHW